MLGSPSQALMIKAKGIQNKSYEAPLPSIWRLNATPLSLAFFTDAENKAEGISLFGSGILPKIYIFFLNVWCNIIFMQSFDSKCIVYIHMLEPKS
ncbi:hypothetical protein V6Z11_1Z012000 [Gossypium hirsutum]